MGLCCSATAVNVPRVPSSQLHPSGQSTCPPTEGISGKSVHYKSRERSNDGVETYTSAEKTETEDTTISDAYKVACDTSREADDTFVGLPNAVIAGNQTMARPGQRPPLIQRPSTLTTTSARPDLNAEEISETKHVKDTPSLRTAFARFEDARKFLLNETKRDIFYFPDVLKMLQERVRYPFDKYESDEIRTVLGNRLAKIGFVAPLLNYYAFVLDELGIDHVSNALFQEGEDESLDLVRLIRDILWNYTDGSHAFTESLAETDMFIRLLGDLKDIYADGLEQLEDAQDMFALSSALSIIHNCARNTNIDRNEFRKLKAVEIMRPYLKSTVLYVKMLTLLTLCNIIREDEVPTLATNEDVFEFLLNAIQSAVTAKDRKCYGFHLFELLDGLAKLAQSDRNKELIMKKQPLGLITKILEQGRHPPELLASVKLVWQLGFLEANKQLILKDKNLLTVLERLKNNANYGLQYAANKAWFVLVGMDKRMKEEPVTQILPSDNKAKHIMISYNWGDKPEVLKIYSALVANGYTVWIDEHEMGKYQNILDGMSEAVEQALVILVCFSEKYKNSQNCRTEAEYAFTRKKEIVPLKMQRGYQADGWLGAFLGARLYIEFSHHYSFDKQIDKLLESLPRPSTMRKPISRGKSPPVNDQQRFSTPAQSDHTRKRIKDWRKPDIEQWAKDFNMRGSAFTKVSKMSAEQIQFIHEVFTKSPGTFYLWAETKFNLGSIEELMKFNNAVKGLAPHV